MDLRKKEELSSSLARLRDSIGGSELEGKDDVVVDLREMEMIWKGIKATLSDWESQRIVNKSVKAWLVELRDLAWEIEGLVGLYEYHVLAMQADEEEEEEEEQEEEEVEKPLYEIWDPCEGFDTPHPLEEDFDFGRWEPERWCSKTLFDRAKANGKRTEVSFGYKLNEVCPSQASPSTPIRSLVKYIFRKLSPSPRKVFIGTEGDDLSTKVTCCFETMNHHIHIQKSLSIGDPVTSRKRKERESDVNIPSPALVDPSLLNVISVGARKIDDRFHQIADREKALSWLRNPIQSSHHNDDDHDDYRSSGCLPENPDSFVGRDKQMEEIVDMLIRIDVNPRKPEVIALVGMGGIGKTTLCQHMYDHSRIKPHFDLMGWVHVGESFHVIPVANNVLGCFTKKRENYDQLSIIQEELMKQLQGKRFLMVMDDVWCEKMELMKRVLAPLMLNNIPGGGSKILITTRNQEVAKAAGAVESISLDLLSEEDGWCLFTKYANIRIDDSRVELLNIGKGIVGKCKGLPLAIKVMGSLMRNKGDDEDSWKGILKSDFSDLNEEGGGRGGRREILGPLYLSYQHLPSHLKACFKFFVFVRNTYYDEQLIAFWLAHNLIGDHHRKTCYREQGRNIIHDFASRSFLEIDYPEREYMEIRVHDLIYDLAEYVAGSEFCIDPPLSDMPWTLPTEARHLRIGDKHSLTKFTLSSVGKMRTIRLNRTDSYKPFSHLPDFNQHANLRFLSADIKRLDVDFHFRHLRVLCIQYSDIEVIPKSFYKLYNLIKLQFIRCNKIKRVSNLVGNLKNLRCLSFIGCYNLQSIPESVSKLTTLEELNLSGCRINELPTGITRLVNLHSLDISDTKIDELPTGITRLVNLHSLDISYLSWMPLGLSNLRKLNGLPSCIYESEGNRFSYYYLGYRKLHHVLTDLNSLNIKEEELHIRVGDYLTGEESEEAELQINGKYHRLVIYREDPEESLSILYSGDDLLNDGEQMLRYLKPHNNIRELEIRDFDSARLPIWMGDQSYHQLVSLKLQFLFYCKTLSPIHKLPSLRQLYIWHLDDLENVVPEEDLEVITSTTKCLHPHQKPSCFPKLEILDIKFCDSMELVPIYRLTTLTELCIHCCYQLCFSRNSVPPQSLKKVSIENCEKLSSWLQSEANSKWKDIIY